MWAKTAKPLWIWKFAIPRKCYKCHVSFPWKKFAKLMVSGFSMLWRKMKILRGSAKHPRSSENNCLTTWPSGKLPFDCQKIAQNLTFFLKKMPKIFIFISALNTNDTAVWEIFFFLTFGKWGFLIYDKWCMLCVFLTIHLCVCDTSRQLLIN